MFAEAPVGHQSVSTVRSAHMACSKWSLFNHFLSNLDVLYMASVALCLVLRPKGLDESRRELPQRYCSSRDAL